MDKMTSPPQKKMAFSPQTESTQDQGGNLDVVSIIRKDAIAQGLDPNQVLYGANQAKKDPKVELIQMGNTVFLCRLIDQGTVEVHMYTADKMNDILKNFMGLAKLLKNQGITKGYTYSENPTFKEIVQRSGMPVKISQTQKQLGGQMKPVYLYEMDL